MSDLSEEHFPAAIKNGGVAHINHVYSDEVAYNNVILKLLEKVYAEGWEACGETMLDITGVPAPAPQDNPYTRPGFENAT